MKMDRQQWGKGRDIFSMQMAWVWTWGWRLIGNLVQSQNVSQFGNVQGVVTGPTGWDRWWWVWLTDLVTILSGWALRSSRPRQTNRTLDTVTTSRTLRPFLTLEEQRHLFYILFIYILKTNSTTEGQMKEKKEKLFRSQKDFVLATVRREKILTGAPFSPAGPGGPWGPGLPDRPIGPAGPAAPLSPGEPCECEKEREMINER